MDAAVDANVSKRFDVDPLGAESSCHEVQKKSTDLVFAGGGVEERSVMVLMVEKINFYETMNVRARHDDLLVVG